MKSTSLTYHTNLLISAPKIHTDLLWDLSLLFIGLAVVYFTAVFFYRNKISRTSEKVKRRKQELSPMISEFLFLEEDATKDEKTNYVALKIEIRQLLKDDFNRKVLSEIILDLRKDISGEAQKSLFKLYQDLGLDKDAFRKLKSWRWEVVSKGILELTQMQVNESYAFITKFINDKRSTIRKQAEIATVTLRYEGINFFLDTTKYKISEWQQLKLLDVIRNKHDFQPPRFKAWLTSNNRHVVLFALRLLKYYNQNDANASLIELIKHKNKQIKEEAVACIKEFNVTEALDTLKVVFWKCNVDVKIAILDAIAVLGTEADIAFLNLIDKKEANFSVKSKALSSINTISPESIMPSRGILDTSKYKIPEDITEAVAKIHAKEHLKLSGDELVEELEENFSEDKKQQELPQEKEDVPTSTEVSAEPKPIGVNEIEVYVEEVLPNSEKENHLDIEVIYENVKSPESISNKTKEEGSDLNFLPFVVATKQKEIVEYQNTDKTKRQRSKFYEEFDMHELFFLPIVIDNDLETTELTEADVLQFPVNFEEVIPEGVHKEEDVMQMVVDFEEVAPKTVENDDVEIAEVEESILSAEVEQTEISLDLHEYGILSLNVGFERYRTAKILELTVAYEEVLGIQELSGSNINDIEIIDPYFLDLELESNMNAVPNERIEKLQEPEKMTVQEEQELLETVNDHIDFDDAEQRDEPLGEFQDWSSLHFDMEEEALHAKIPKASFPKAIFGDIEFEASTRQLLNDLEELGDQREMPLLRELLEHSKYEPFQARIDNLMKKFNNDGPKETSNEALKPFSVFQDLFRTCDTEAKLILLDEVVAVGDQKDIDFLNSLLIHYDSRIKYKAHKVLHALEEKLQNASAKSAMTIDEEPLGTPSGFSSLMEELKISTSDPSDIFDLNFEFTQPEHQNDSKAKAMDSGDRDIKQGSFFGQLCSFSHKILGKFNG